jgi:hypothetical protein
MYNDLLHVNKPMYWTDGNNTEVVGQLPVQIPIAKYSCFSEICSVASDLRSRLHNAGQNRDIINSKQIVSKCVTLKIFWNNSNKSKFYSGRNYEENELW